MTIKTKCIKCGRTYIHYNDVCTVCRKVPPNPFDVFNNLDSIDIDKELDIIYDEIDEENRKGRVRTSGTRSSNTTMMTAKDIKGLWHTMEKRTISDHKKREAAKHE